LAAFSSGQDRDPESGVNHMAHVMCNAAFLLNFDKHQRRFDDRYNVQQEPAPVINFGFENRFLYTFSRQEYEEAADPDHWYSIYFPNTPLFMFDDEAEFQTVWNIYAQV
jgi:hypothetical protein